MLSTEQKELLCEKRKLLIELLRLEDDEIEQSIIKLKIDDIEETMCK